MKKTRQQIANSIARRAGYWRATKVRQGEKSEVVSHERGGWRKNSNNQYVPMAYVNKAWSAGNVTLATSVYYFHARTVVSLSPEDWNRGKAAELINKIKE